MTTAKKEYKQALLDTIELHEKLILEGLDRMANLHEQIQANKEVNKKYQERIKEAIKKIKELD